MVFTMKVSEVLSFEDYWEDPRFQPKRPKLTGSLKQAFGDNIYHRDPETHEWIQENSHHSLPDGRPNAVNVRRDTSGGRVLVSSEFIYWGSGGPEVPAKFRHYSGYDICVSFQGHKCVFPEELPEEFQLWVRSLEMQGFMSEPADWQDSRWERRR